MVSWYVFQPIAMQEGRFQEHEESVIFLAQPSLLHACVLMMLVCFRYGTTNRAKQYLAAGNTTLKKKDQEYEYQKLSRLFTRPGV